MNNKDEILRQFEKTLSLQEEALTTLFRYAMESTESASSAQKLVTNAQTKATDAQGMITGTDPLSDPYPGPPLWDTDWDALKIMHEWSNRYPKWFPEVERWTGESQKWTNVTMVKTHSRGIYAGALFLVLNNWIHSLGVQLGLQQQEDRLSMGEPIGKTQLSRLIWAAANNFRHYAEWGSLTTQAQKSITVLQEAGVTGLMSENRAADVLNIIGAKDYKNLEAKIYAIGRELKKKAP
jgi:hypothetical protein